MKLAIVFMLMLLATIEVIGAYFTRQLEQTSIENFQSSIQIQTVVSNQLANQLTSDSKNANDRLNQIVNDYNNDAISEIIVVDNKDTIRAVSNLNDKSKIGQRINNTDVKRVISTGHQINKVIDDHGNYMIQISPLTSGNGSNNNVGAIYVKASMQDVFNNLRQISLTFLIASLIAALLVGVAAMLLVNTRSVSEFFKENLQVSVMMKQEVSDEEAAVFKNEIDSMRFVRNAELITKARGEKEMAEMLGADFLSVFETSPIPVSIVVTLDADYVSESLDVAKMGKDSIKIVMK